MTREELQKKLDDLAGECCKDFPAIAGILFSSEGSLISQDEISLYLYVREWSKANIAKIKGQMN